MQAPAGEVGEWKRTYEANFNRDGDKVEVIIRLDDPEGEDFFEEHVRGPGFPDEVFASAGPELYEGLGPIYNRSLNGVVRARD